MPYSKINVTWYWEDLLSSFRRSWWKTKQNCCLMSTFSWTLLMKSMKTAPFRRPVSKAFPPTNDFYTFEINFSVWLSHNCPFVYIVCHGHCLTCLKKKSDSEQLIWRSVRSLAWAKLQQSSLVFQLQKEAFFYFSKAEHTFRTLAEKISLVSSQMHHLKNQSNSNGQSAINIKFIKIESFDWENYSMPNNLIKLDLWNTNLLQWTCSSNLNHKSNQNP